MSMDNDGGAVTVSGRRTQAERRERTRTALLAAARELFAERGFADTGREDIAERAGVTRGALYHHFDSKAAVAAAVVEAVDAELVERVIAAAERGADPFDRLRRSCRAYIDACAEPDVARILLEAPLVLTPDELRAMNEASCVQLLEPALERLGVAGDRLIAAHLLLGMLNEAATLVASKPRVRRRVNETVDAFLERLLHDA
jgi:AcrR family transcriptional regulator